MAPTVTLLKTATFGPRRSLLYRHAASRGTSSKTSFVDATTTSRMVRRREGGGGRLLNPNRRERETRISRISTRVENAILRPTFQFRRLSGFWMGEFEGGG